MWRTQKSISSDGQIWRALVVLTLFSIIASVALSIVNGGAISSRRGGVKSGQLSDIADMQRGPIGPLWMSAAKIAGGAIRA